MIGLEGLVELRGVLSRHSAGLATVRNLLSHWHSEFFTRVFHKAVFFWLVWEIMRIFKSSNLHTTASTWLIKDILRPKIILYAILVPKPALFTNLIHKPSLARCLKNLYWRTWHCALELHGAKTGPSHQIVWLHPPGWCQTKEMKAQPAS